MITLFEFLSCSLTSICVVILIVLMWSKRLIIHNFNKKTVCNSKYLSVFSLLNLKKNNKEKIEEKITELKSKISLHKNWCKNIVINEMIRFKKKIERRVKFNNYCIIQKTGITFLLSQISCRLKVLSKVGNH